MFIKYGFCGYAAPTPFFNRFVMNDGTVYPIDDPYLFAFTGINSPNHPIISNGQTVNITKNNVAEVHVRIPIEPINNLFCAQLFRLYQNPAGTLMDVELIYDESVEITIPNGYNDFFNAMFYGSNIRFPEDSKFTIPANITRIIGEGFCRSMFQNCTIQNFPNSFTFMPKLYNVSDTFCFAMFYNANFGPALPSGFNLPGIIEWDAGTSRNLQYCVSMFDSCTNLVGLPRNFKLTENAPPRSADSSIFAQMFINCTNLRNDLANGVMLYFPYPSTNCFGGTCPVTPTSPTAGSTVYVSMAEI